jgi:hypothetical protein
MPQASAFPGSTSIKIAPPRSATGLGRLAVDPSRVVIARFTGSHPGRLVVTAAAGPLSHLATGPRLGLSGAMAEIEGAGRV